MGRKLFYIAINRFICFVILVLAQEYTVYSQQKNLPSIDSLMKLDFEELYQKQFTEKDPYANKWFAKAYLQKAKDLDSISEMARGYFWISFLVADNYEKQIIYIDSGIAKVKNTEHVLQTGSMCNTKGIIMQQKGDYNKALEYYLEGLQNSRKMNSLYYKSIFNSKIATLKRKLGKYDEAKFLYKKCLQYEKLKKERDAKDSLWYLMKLSDLTSTYLLDKEIDSAHYFYNQGKKLSQSTDIKGVYTLNKGIFQYYEKDYDQAILSINQGIEEFLNCKFGGSYGYHNLINGYFYLGKSYNILRQQEAAMGYFKKIDSFVQLSNDLISEARPAYPELIKYYKAIKDNNNQLYYINRLLYNDSIFHSRYKSTTDKLNTEFDTPLLIAQKENIIQELRTKNYQSYYIILISLLVIIAITGVLYTSRRKNKQYKERFDSLMLDTPKEVTKTNVPTDHNTTTIDIDDDVVNLILSELEDFEKNNGFLEIKLTSAMMAKNMNTNSKYLTKVIKYYRGKTFSPYINDLRIEYIIERLKTDKKIRNYTIKALAKEAGFNSSEVFSKSFYKKTGIYPSYFIKQLSY
ncbi:helix-turn-helix domain-containing protein [Aquimarina sp. MMG016]|uniref:helix-turn-helix domain-containing protein n=1 Tax=Aquimarina sp. MMG016 TaxID=2822690 RepID=UPI001B3A577C|nr:helix-turn-helix domain-containing protein [Aquimarina sp. MMG016]MBQ4818854.1 helix-turn-helix domain-containing protein [Aquimarina sp. MMG016]